MKLEIKPRAAQWKLFALDSQVPMRPVRGLSGALGHGLWACGTGVAHLPPPWCLAHHPHRPLGPPGDKPRWLQEGRAPVTAAMWLFKTFNFPGSMSCHPGFGTWNPLGLLPASRWRWRELMHGLSPTATRSFAPLLLDKWFLLPHPAAPPAKSLSFLVFYTFHLGKSSEPVCCWWLVNEIFLFTELPQTWRASTCMLSTNNFCKYAFIWWLPCLRMILYIFLDSLDIFLNASKVFTLSNRPFYLPDLLTFKIIASACVMLCWLQ